MHSSGSTTTGDQEDSADSGPITIECRCGDTSVEEKNYGQRIADPGNVGSGRFTMTAETAALAPRIVSVEAAEKIQPFGLDMRVMLDAAATGGTFSAIVVELKPGEGPPPHLHRDREEFFYVLDGTYRMMVDGNEPARVTDNSANSA
jgi:mannose-6-phosphate isomerase-like protein (cupin superfamily)